MPKRRKKQSFSSRVQKVLDKNIETKLLNNAWDGVNIQDSGRTPLSQNLTQISQGIAQNQRLGNQVRLTGLYLDGVIVAADTSNTVRVLVYSPKDPSNEITNLAFNQSPDMDQFDVYYDRFVAVGTNGGLIARRIRFKKSFKQGGRSKGRIHQFTGSGGTTYQTRPIFLYMVSDSLAVSDPDFSGHVTTYYKDA